MQQDPQTRVSAPAVGIIVTGGIGALFTLGYLALVAFVGVAALTGEDAAEALPGVGVMVAVGVFNLAVAGFLIYAGLQMRAVRGWGLSMAAAIAAMIPCVSPCCILGLPIGIWAILVLIDEEIKRAFNGDDPAGGGPGGTGPYGGPGGPGGSSPYGGPGPSPNDPYPGSPPPGGPLGGSQYPGGPYPGGPYPGGPAQGGSYTGEPTQPSGPYPGSPPPLIPNPDRPPQSGR